MKRPDFPKPDECRHVMYKQGVTAHGSWASVSVSTKPKACTEYEGRGTCREIQTPFSRRVGWLPSPSPRALTGGSPVRKPVTSPVPGAGLVPVSTDVGTYVGSEHNLMGKASP